AKGMTVITGETGAGKSIMLDALGLALGDRADKEVVRDTADRADISACFLIGENTEARAWLQNHDFSGQETMDCILRRVISRDGRSRAYINGQPTTLNELRELGDMLLDIHSQHEHQSLLKQPTHQRLLDAFCGTERLASRVRETAIRWRRLQQSLQEAQARTDADSAQFQLLSYQVRELDELDLGTAELSSLEEEHKALTHAESSLAVTRQALDLCSENEEHNIQQSLSQVLALIQDIPYADRHVNEAGNLLNTALIQVEEAASELSRSLDKVEIDPARLEEVDQRLADIHQLARKHRVSPKDLPTLHQELQDQLAQMSQSDAQLESMQQELQDLLGSYAQSAADLSRQRKASAPELEQEINAQLARLGMPGASFSLALNSEISDTPEAGGYENVEFLVSTNPGQTPRPLIKVASGGELSRISLAIQVVTARTSAIPTLVFDEVDVGVGGGVARAVGELLRQLGETGQIICVTHQAQVASQGHQHLYVSKSSGQSGTSAEIRMLDKQQRVEEIARMLGGDKLSDQSVAHAQELMT
ncbi:MAG: DNA repair protein RecN, partial [Pseudohongiellaceae bacterium]